MDPQFKRGEFRSYRAVTRLHLGALEEDLQEGEVVDYDGTTMKRGPDVHQLASLRAAIKVGWLVPDEQEGGSYVAKPAGVEVRPAESRGRERGPARSMGMVEAEERDLGSITDVRREGSPEVHVAATGKKVSRGAPTGAKVMSDTKLGGKTVTESGQEGRVIGRFKSAAQSERVDVSTGADRKIQSQIEKTEGVQIVKKAVASGDVQETISGEELEELLPEAASSGTPEPGIAGEGDDQESGEERAIRLAKAKRIADAKLAERKAALFNKNMASDKATVSATGPSIQNTEAVVGGGHQEIDATATVSRGMTSVGGAEDGRVVGKIGQTPKAGVPPVDDLSDEPDIEFKAESDEDDVPAEAIIQAKIEMIQQFVPGFQWDMNLQWAKRVKLAVETYGSNMPVINAILSIETPAVRKHIMRRLYGET